MMWTVLAAVLLAYACTEHAYGLESKYPFKTGETLQFVGDSTSFRYHPSKSGNCSNCFLFFKLGALSELDAYGQPVMAHMLPDLSKLDVEASSGRSIAGDAEYEYVTMRFSSQSLLETLTAQACPTLESILRQASEMGITDQGGGQGLGIGALDAPSLAYGSDPAASALVNPTSAAALATVMSQSSLGVASPNREVAETSGRRRSLRAHNSRSPAASTATAVWQSVVQPMTRLATPAAGAAAQSTHASAARQATIPFAIAQVAPFTAPAQTAGGRFVDGGSLPYLKVTFMFGFSNNRTFPYGRGNVLSAPAGSVRWTLEAQNWPFCSPYNTLKLELVAVSSMRDNQAQFVLTSPEIEEEEEPLIDAISSMPGDTRMIPSVRKLQAAHQYADSYGASFFEPDTSSSSAGGLAFGPLARPALPSNVDPMTGLQLLQDALPANRLNTAKLLVGPALATTINLPTFALSNSNFTGLSNISVALANNNTDGAARFSITFAYFRSGLYYDSVMYFSNMMDMHMMAETGSMPVASMRAGANCLPEDEACVNSRQSTRRTAINAASSPRDSLGKCNHIWALLLALFGCLLY